MMLFRLENILESMIALNKDIVAIRSSSEHLFNNESFNKEYATIRLDVGRQTGKTLLICYKAGINDVIICHNTSQLEHIQQVLESISPIVKQQVYTKNDLCNHYAEEYTVWVDDSSVFTAEELNEVYKKYDNASRFILLG